MYSIPLPIHIFKASSTEFYLPVGLARDILAHLKYETNLNILCPFATNLASITSPYHLNLDDHPGLSITLLPYNGRRSFFLRFFEVARILQRTAKVSTVWHTGCSTKIFDLTTLSFHVGQLFAPKMRVLCLDSDPASMIAGSGLWKRWKAPIIRARYRRRVRLVDATIFVGTGVANIYAKFCRNFVTTAAVWLNEGDLADKGETIQKFEEQHSNTVRISLPTRLTDWKGVDDALSALTLVRDELPSWHLDIIGDGPMKGRLRKQANDLQENVSFHGEISYGEPFFSKLRSYHIVLIPTRGLEEARVAYDAAASGCLIVHSASSTLKIALSGVRTRWEFEPGNVDSLANAILSVFSQRQTWKDAALQGIEAMRGRTIEEMHHARSIFLQSLMAVNFPSSKKSHNKSSIIE